ncbi:MAG: dihydrolipoyllysine-residue acetyltransferase [Steroidobacteraceae bacterium]
MSQLHEVHVPDMGSFSEVGVIDILVKPGDVVAVDTPLITLESEKATMDVPSTGAGVVEKVHVAQGSKVSTGTLVVTLRSADAPAAASTGATPAPPAAAAPAAAATPAAAGAAQSIDVIVPDLGNFADVSIIDVLVKPGDTVEVDTPLATLETEKATMDVPSTAGGVVEAVHIKTGGRVSAGARVVTLKGSAPAASAASAPPAAAAAPVAAPTPAPQAAAPAAAPAAQAAAPISEAGFSKAHAGPSVRKLARELGVDLSRVKGTGQKGRITHEDVKSWVKQALASGASQAGASRSGGGAGLPPVPAVDFAKFGAVEIKPLGRIQKISGPRLHASWVNLPHVTQFEEADITDLETERKRLKDKAAEAGIKLTPLAFIVRACVKALQEYPQFNASLDASGENVVYKKYINVGFAADTPDGLLVPVIHNADRMDIYAIARALADLSERARKGALKGTEMQGGCFTISSLGGIGGTAFTPIVNAPEAAILGVSKAQMKPVWDGKAFVPRQMLPLSLSYDHRLIDGAAGARFAVHIAKMLATPAGLIEAVP